MWNASGASGKQPSNRHAAIGDRDGTGSVEQFVARVDPQRRVWNRGVKMGTADRRFHRRFAGIVGYAISAVQRLRSAARQDERESGALMSPTPAAIKGRGVGQP